MLLGQNLTWQGAAGKSHQPGERARSSETRTRSEGAGEEGGPGGRRSRRGLHLVLDLHAWRQLVLLQRPVGSLNGEERGVGGDDLDPPGHPIIVPQAEERLVLLKGLILMENHLGGEGLEDGLVHVQRAVRLFGGGGEEPQMAVPREEGLEGEAPDG